MKYVIFCGSVTLSQEDDRWPTKWRILKVMNFPPTDSLFEARMLLRQADSHFRSAVSYANEDVVGMVRVDEHKLTVVAWSGPVNADLRLSPEVESIIHSAEDGDE